MHALSFVHYSLIHMTNWIINGLPERFPKLKVLWVESGLAWIPFLMQRLDHEYQMRSCEAPLLKRLPSEYMRDMFYTSQPLEKTNLKLLQATMEAFNAETQLLYASDWPHWDFDPPSAITTLPFLTDQAKRNILGLNAARVFNLEVKRKRPKADEVLAGAAGRFLMAIDGAAAKTVARRRFRRRGRARAGAGQPGRGLGRRARTGDDGGGATLRRQGARPRSRRRSRSGRSGDADRDRGDGQRYDPRRRSQSLGRVDVVQSEQTVMRSGVRKRDGVGQGSSGWSMREVQSSVRRRNSPIPAARSSASKTSRSRCSSSDGEFFAYLNQCPHMGGPACQGKMIAKVEEIIADDRTSKGMAFSKTRLHVVCPWHGFEFDIRTGVHPGNPRARLRKIEVAVSKGEVMITVPDARERAPAA